MKKVLLFGTGFIATNLIEHFYRECAGVECVVVYNKTKLDCRDEIRQYPMSESVQGIFQKEQPDNLIVLHGNSYVPDNQSIFSSVSENLLKATSFLEEIWEHKLFVGLNKIIVVGSASEYGQQYQEPIKEDFPLWPTSVYGFAKICLYNAVQLFVSRGLPIVYARQFNAVGPGQREDFVLPGFLSALAAIEKGQREPLMTVGDLSQERDFIDIRDVCRAYTLLLEAGVVGEVYNIASGNHVSIEALLQLAIQSSSIDSDELSIEQNQNMFLNKEKLSKRLQADVGKINALGFSCKYSLEQTVKDTLNYWRANV